jgi:hypothetical protein
VSSNLSGERGVGRERVEEVRMIDLEKKRLMEHGKVFRYFRDNQWKTKIWM